MAGEFVLVRLTKISGSDLNVFDFDYDLNWFAFFLNADEKVYGRYGGRDARSAENRLSLKGLRHALQAALETHRKETKGQPRARTEKPLRVEEYPAAKRLKSGECIHCHQVYEFRRDFLKSGGKWRKDEVWVYPLPENVGLTLDIDAGDRVRSVARGSPADAAGLRGGDVLRTVNGVSVASIADAQYGLHRAAAKGKVPVAWLRDGTPMTAELNLPEGWRRTNITWRPSLLDVLPAPDFEGDDLTLEEKKALQLSDKQLAFRLGDVDDRARDAGLKKGDVVVGVEGLKLEMAMIEFFGHLRKNYLAGERVTFNVLRDGKAVDVPLTLR